MKHQMGTIGLTEEQMKELMQLQGNDYLFYHRRKINYNFRGHQFFVSRELLGNIIKVNGVSDGIAKIIARLSREHSK